MTAVSIEERVSRLEGGYEHVATKADVAEFRAATQADVAEFRAATQADIGDLKASTQG